MPKVLSYKELGRRVEESGGEFVIFSAFKTVQYPRENRFPGAYNVEWLVEDNLDETAVKGEVKFVQEHEGFWGEGSDYKSPVVKDPTWLQVALLADEMIQMTGDKDHVYLEGIREVRAGVYQFIMGS